jgi:predicted N-formylglutamate amidohydrolase
MIIETEPTAGGLIASEASVSNSAIYTKYAPPTKASTTTIEMDKMSADVENKTLLCPDEPPPFQIVHDRGRSAYFLTCDHGGKLLPRALSTLGLGPIDLDRHIAWDIGAAALARKLSDALDGWLIVQTYSRLAIDCNRPLHSPTSIAPISEATPIPGNQHVSAADADTRRCAIFQPYHDRIVAELDARKIRGRPTILVTVHTFTPEFHGERRPWHVGVLYHRDARLARILLDLFRDERALVVGDNQPYSVNDESDYAIPIYGERRSIPHVELEVRQDLLVDESGQGEWAQRLARALLQAEPLIKQSQ